MKITELNFIEVIEQLTGKVLGLDYGFIVGTFTPFGNVKGFISANQKEGFIVWKYTDDRKNGEQLHIKERNTIEENVKIIVEWLKK